MHRYRRHIASACLVLLGLPLLLLLGMQLWQYGVRQEMKEKLDTAGLLTLRLAEQDLVWEEEGRELRIGGQLFDVQDIRLHEGGYEVTGLYDHQETAIENWLAGQWGDENRLLLGLLLVAQAAALLPLLTLSLPIRGHLRHYARFPAWRSYSLPFGLLRPPARLQF